ncbi:hypothetical protein H1C71_011828 [Ictidomys tridecemlineatus]|nr:hypothetical protein H1C71_011828 [Ictidomys tridecemlineatus]
MREARAPPQHQKGKQGIYGRKPSARAGAGTDSVLPLGSRETAGLSRRPQRAGLLCLLVVLASHRQQDPPWLLGDPAVKGSQELVLPLPGLPVSQTQAWALMPLC